MSTVASSTVEAPGPKAQAPSATTQAPMAVPAAPSTNPAAPQLAPAQQMGALVSKYVGTSEACLNAKVKAPKVVIGPVEVGLKIKYAIKGAACDALPALSTKRATAVVSIKDIWVRGKLEVDAQNSRATYSKKVRVPYLNTEALKVQVTADWSGGVASGVLGHVLGLQLQFGSDTALPRNFVRKAPDYALNLQPRVGPPQCLFSACRFPGSLYAKADGTLHVKDAPRLADVSAKLELREINLVAKLYDTAAVKPSQFERRVTRLAWAPLADAAGVSRGKKDGEGQQQPKGGVTVIRVIEKEQPHEPDVIDVAANKVREWAHAIAVNTCVANKQLQEFVQAKLKPASSS